MLPLANGAISRLYTGDKKIGVSLSESTPEKFAAYMCFGDSHPYTLGAYPRRFNSRHPDHSCLVFGLVVGQLGLKFIPSNLNVTMRHQPVFGTIGRLLCYEAECHSRWRESRRSLQTKLRLRLRESY